MGSRAVTPVVDTLVAFVAVFAVQQVVGLVGLASSLGTFALASPVTARPWTLPLSVYAHGSLQHLLSNALGLVLFGIPVARVTSRVRFHLYFVTVGALAAVTQVGVSGLVGSPVAVLGASGAVFGLLVYLLASNRLTDAVAGRFQVSRRVQLAALAVVAVAITLTTAAPGVALVAHFAGLALGLVAGRVHLLRT